MALTDETAMESLAARSGEAFFVARGFEQRATDEQVAGIREFSYDLDFAIRGT